jgi:hypothetical protein
MARNRFGLLLAGLAASWLIGCQQDEIRTYSVAKPEMTRLLGAILAHGGSTWFFKLSGPSGQVGEHVDEFTKFLQSLRPAAAPEKPLSWTLPQGWREDKEKRPQRYATILVGKEPPLELTVTRLGHEGQASSVLANVNRWRNQLGLPDVSQEELAKDVTEIKAGPDTITVVNLVGAGSGKTGMGPSVASERMPPAVVNRRSELNYSAPAGWKKVPDAKMSKATFEVAEDGRRAIVTITPLGGGAGGLEANVHRWREQVGLPKVSDEQARKLVTTLSAAGKEYAYVDLSGSTRRLLVAIVPQGDTTWFVKMDGPVDLLGKQKASFEAFVQSVRFDGGPGGNDG